MPTSPSMRKIDTATVPSEAAHLRDAKPAAMRRNNFPPKIRPRHEP
jgi:hypothetical protein